VLCHLMSPSIAVNCSQVEGKPSPADASAEMETGVRFCGPVLSVPRKTYIVSNEAECCCSQDLTSGVGRLGVKSFGIWEPHLVR